MIKKLYINDNSISLWWSIPLLIISIISVITKDATSIILFSLVFIMDIINHIEIIEVKEAHKKTKR